jgi:hypothetical protein
MNQTLPTSITSKSTIGFIDYLILYIQIHGGLIFNSEWLEDRRHSMKINYWIENLDDFDPKRIDAFQKVIVSSFKSDDLRSQLLRQMEVRSQPVMFSDSCLKPSRFRSFRLVF